MRWLGGRRRLQDLGVSGATDLEGGFAAWKRFVTTTRFTPPAS